MPLAEDPLSPRDIVVPDNLPMILKEFCKAAIRTQPYDLLKWSSSYFRALADGEEPPTKVRLEYPPPCTSTGLTLGFLRVLLRQFGDYNKMLPVETILRRWDCLCLDRRDLNLIMSIGKFRRKCQVKKFLAIAVGLLCSSLFDTMIMICELFTHEPEGGSTMIPVTLFMELYGYLAGLRCDGSERRSSEDVGTTSSEVSVNVGSDGYQRQSVCESNQSLAHVLSITSQDTDADVNLDLELVSKGDSESARSNITMDTPDNHADEKGIENLNKSEVSSASSDQTMKNEGAKASSSEAENRPEKQSSNALLKQASLESKDTSVKHKSHSSDSKLPRSRVSEHNDCTLSSADEKKRRTEDGRRKRYPNVPGIGPRLSAEQIASVAIWMSECARLQEGMVGPRNLRHINCPPLDKEESSES